MSEVLWASWNTMLLLFFCYGFDCFLRFFYGGLMFFYAFRGCWFRSEEGYDDEGSRWCAGVLVYILVILSHFLPVLWD